MGDEYTGPVTVAADDGTEKTLENIEIWSQSETIMEMVKDTDPGDTIPLASVGKEALEKTVEYMEQVCEASLACDRGRTMRRRCSAAGPGGERESDEGRGGREGGN